MTVRYHEAVVTKIVDEGCGARTYRLEFPGGNPFEFCAGQSVRVEVPGGPAGGQPCPVVSSPLEKDFIEVTLRGRSAAQGPLELRGGETVRVSSPEGRWCYADGVKNAVLLAEGAAVAPYRSMIRYVLGKGLPNNVALFYAEKTPSCILFRQELEEFSRKGVQVFISITDPPSLGQDASWNGATGPITAEVLRRAVGKLKEPTYFVSGPASFVDGMRALLDKAGVAPAQVLAEEAAL